MEFRPARPEDYEAVRQFLAGVGWQQRVSDPERFRKMLEKTTRTVVVWDGQLVIGFARALCDEASNGYISMVAVAADYRGRGIGRKLIEHLTSDESGSITWILRAGHGSERFWEKIGFRASEVAMEKVRQK
jgi:ribosomal protein S18 acetylase RimI-like enzyme